MGTPPIFGYGCAPIATGAGIFPVFVIVCVTVKPVRGQFVAHGGLELEGITEFGKDVGGLGHARGVPLRHDVGAVPQETVDGVVERGLGQREAAGLPVVLPHAVLDAVRPGHEHDPAAGRRGRVERVRLREVDAVDSQLADARRDLRDRRGQLVAACGEREFVLVTGGCAHAD